jgi:serine/threonine protein kinase
MSNDVKSFEGRQCVEGELLENYVKIKYILSIDEIYKIILNLCRIVEDFHKGDFFIIHRELNPSNIIIMENEEVTLIYKKSSLHMFHSKNTNLEHHRLWKLSKQNDLHSIGMIIYFMATGRLPCTVLDIFIDNNYPDNIDKNLKRIIYRCFEGTDENQYLSVEELSTEINMEMLKDIRCKEIIDLSNLNAEIGITTQRRRGKIKSSKSIQFSEGFAYLKHLIRKSKKVLQASTRL